MKIVKLRSLMRDVRFYYSIHTLYFMVELYYDIVFAPYYIETSEDLLSAFPILLFEDSCI